MLVFLLEIYLEMSSQVWARQHYKDGKNNLFSHDSVGFYGENTLRLLSAVSTFLYGLVYVR